MKRRLSFLYWELRYRFLKWKWNRTAKDSKIDGIVLMYHHVTDDNVDTIDSCKCSIKEFQTVLKNLKDNCHRFVSVEEMLDIIEKKGNEKFAVVTFDDVPLDFYNNAYPILKKMCIPFTLFIATDYIDKPGFLSKQQIVELDHDELCAIGAHTVSHPMLRKISNSRYELTESKRVLEELLSHSINYMAYPYGRQSSVSKRIMKETQQAGYQCAFGTIQTPITDESSKNIFYLPRIVRK